MNEVNNYVPYHVHTMYSNGIIRNLIDSITDFHSYVDLAKKYGMKAIGFTEHGSIFSWLKKKEYIESIGMKYIHAVEVYLTEDNKNKYLYSASLKDKNTKVKFTKLWKNANNNYFAKVKNNDNTKEEILQIDKKTLKKESLIKTKDNYHCVLIAKNFQGFKEINKLISRSFNRNDFHYYYVPRVSFDELFATSDNVIVTSACLGGVLAKGTSSTKERFLKFLKDNNHRCFLEIQHHICKKQAKYNTMLWNLSEEINVPLIAGTDTHSLNSDHAKGREILQKAKNISFENEEDFDLTFKNFDELLDAYQNQNALPISIIYQAIENTNLLADSIEPFTLDYNTKYPKIYDNAEETYKQKINKAYISHPYIRKRYSPTEINSVLRNELEIYKKTNSIDFMLLQTYLREWETKHDIYCGYGRGSVSGSEIAYTLGITQMDSKKFNLNFFRFINPDRVTNADIDTDYSPTDRDRVKEFILKDKLDLPNINTSEIITFNTLDHRGVIKEICRALFKDTTENYLLLSEKIIELYETNINECQKKYPKVFDYIFLLKGVITSVGTHASGVLISDLDIASEIGLCSLSTSDYPVSMLNMKELDKLMYVKLDILGLSNLNLINETCKLAGIERVTPDNINLNDENVWIDIAKDTTLIFQWESDSAKDYLKKFMSDKTINIAKKHIKDFSYIKWFSFGNGLIRPGCASFRDSVANGEIIKTGFSELDNFLSITFGRIVMQEDIMQFLVKFCGYSGSESDTVRRCIAKKIGTENVVNEIHDRFIDYSSKTYNQDKDKLEKIFPPIKQGILDATGYAFSWNHSDAYSCIGYACGYLRYYYPLEFVTAALNTFADNKEKSAKIISYAKSKGININPIKFRKSIANYTFDKTTNTIYKGISSIKFMNEQIAEELYKIKDNVYCSFIEILFDLETTSLNSKQIKILIVLDFFEEFGEINVLLKKYDMFLKLHTRRQLRKNELTDLGLTIEVVKQCSKKETEKMFTNVDTKKLLKVREKTITAKKLTLCEKIKYQFDYLGYIDIVGEQYKGLVVVLDLDTKYTPKVKLYSLKNGGEFEGKISKKLFNIKKLEKSNLIRIKSFTKKAKSKRDENGKWIKIDNLKELWITDYEITKI